MTKAKPTTSIVNSRIHLEIHPGPINQDLASAIRAIAQAAEANAQAIEAAAKMVKETVPQNAYGIYVEGSK